MIVPSDLLAREAITELAAGRAVDEAIVEGIAEQIRRDAASDGLDDIAAESGLSVAERAMDPGLPGLRWSAILMVQRFGDRSVRRIVGAHECGHQVLRDLRVHHVHGDVWALALALLMPLSMVRRHRGALALAAKADVPAWAAATRLKMPSVLEALREF